MMKKYVYAFEEGTPIVKAAAASAAGKIKKFFNRD